MIIKFLDVSDFLEPHIFFIKFQNSHVNKIYKLKLNLVDKTKYLINFVWLTFNKQQRYTQHENAPYTPTRI